MYKLSTFLAESDHGYAAIPLFGPADATFEKTAAPNLLPTVLKYIETLKPRAGSQYVLVNAMGASEYYSSNVNGDWFEEIGLLHEPPGWGKSHITDRELGKKWTYGYPTFYNAHPFAHHRNKDPGRAYGEVELAVWNEHMKRVELVCRVDKDKCERFGGVGVWDKLRAGQYADVSMGSRVCYDLASVGTDWALYRKALSTYKPGGRHAYPGLAVVAYHNDLKRRTGKGIPGVSITRADYSEFMRANMNKILPDGRKVFVYNPYPRFFDISFVFIGADRTAKVMVFIVRHGDTRYVPSAEAGEKIAGVLADDAGEHSGFEKAASVRDQLQDVILKTAFTGKSAAVLKKGEIAKDVSSNLGKAMPLIEKSEQDVPSWAMRMLKTVRPSEALGTTAGMGIVLKPHEFKEIVIQRVGGDAGDIQPVPFSDDNYMPSLARLLLPLLAMRSALAPFLEARAIMCTRHAPCGCSSLNDPDLRKIGSAYQAYRESLMTTVAGTQQLLSRASFDAETAKLASADAAELFTPFVYQYLREAFLSELQGANGG